jgi:hypothetical protein
MIVFFLGAVGVVAGSRGQRGWDLWTGRQKVVCSLAFAMVMAGLALADAGQGRL